MVGFYMQLSQTDERRVLHVLAQVKNMGMFNATILTKKTKLKKK
jgi:hypothetical protein